MIEKRPTPMEVVPGARVNVRASLLAMQKDSSSVACQELASLGTVRSTCYRLNQRAGYKEFEVTSPDNGATLVVTRVSETTANRQAS